MPLKFLLDENIETLFLDAIRRHNQSGVSLPIDVIRVGDPPNLPLGSSDPTILLWAEQNGCILISHDASTLPLHFGNHLAAGRHCPGIFLVSAGADIQNAIELLAAAAESENPADWQDLIEYLG